MRVATSDVSIRPLQKEVSIVKLICALVLVVVIVPPSLGQQSLVGTYKIVSQDVQVNGTATQPLGKAPHRG